MSVQGAGVCVSRCVCVVCRVSVVCVCASVECFFVKSQLEQRKKSLRDTHLLSKNRNLADRGRNVCAILIYNTHLVWTKKGKQLA